MSTETTHQEAEDRLNIRVLRGDLNEEEIAALTTALVATHAHAPDPARPKHKGSGPRSQGRAILRRALLALPTAPGPGAWRRKR